MRLDNYPMKKNGMFILKRPDFDQIAKGVLEEYLPHSLEYPQPIDIEYLAQECLFLDIKHEYLSVDGRVLGLIAFSDTQFPTRNLENEPTVIDVEEGTMLIDMRLIGKNNLARKRFTEAHEASHWICHRSYHSPSNQLYDFKTDKKPVVVCRKESIEQYRLRGEGKYSDEFWEEWQADCLAAALLMPKEMFHAAVKDIMKRNGFSRNYLIKGVDDYKAKQVIHEIMELFMVSFRAVQIRMMQFGMIKE